jgi:uncharacterized protein YggE
MKKIFLIVIALFSPSLAWSGVSDLETILVSGVGELNINPDIAYLTLGVETTDKTAKGGQQKNAQLSAQVEKILIDRFKIARDDIKTVSYNVFEDVSYVNNKRERLGYKVANSIQVNVRAIKEIGNILDAVADAGANSVQGIQFDTEKRRTYEIEALKLAVENARKKADVIAVSAGRSIKKALKIDESKASSGPIAYKSMESARGASMMADASSTTPINSGSLKIVADVAVLFQM